MSHDRRSRRAFLKLGSAVSGAGLVASVGSAKLFGQGAQSADSGATSLSQGIDLEKWNRIKGKPYELGAFGALPHVCQLPGPQKKRNWPDRNKYKGARKVPGMCQLCSTVCGVMGYVKDGRVIKLEGNPNDPNSRGHTRSQLNSTWRNGPRPCPKTQRLV